MLPRTIIPVMLLVAVFGVLVIAGIPLHEIPERLASARKAIAEFDPATLGFDAAELQDLLDGAVNALTEAIDITSSRDDAAHDDDDFPF